MSQLEKCDRRSLRSQRALRQALASELAESGDLSRINVASLTERAGLTRRTFYSAFANSSIKSITFRSFTKGENLTEKLASSRFI